MSTDFFTSQDHARKQTGRLVFLFIAQRLDMTVVAADVEAAFMQGDP